MAQKILLADDHSIVRSGIKGLINDNFSFVEIEEAWDEYSITEKIKSNDYDLIILDINMPNTDSYGLLKWIITYKPNSKILVFSMYSEDIYGRRYIQAGAKGYIRKSESDAEIVKAIGLVLVDKRYMSQALLDLLLSNPTKNIMSNPLEILSSREMEIAILLNKGTKLPQICELLNIEYSTANTHKRRIYEKLSVNSLAGLFRLMQEYGESLDAI